MAYNNVKIATAILATFALAACASKAQTVNYIQGNEDQLYQTAVSNIKNDDFTKADQVLTQLSLQYPFGNYKSQVAAMQVYDSYKLTNFSLALTQASNYLQSGNSQYADYVLLMHALAATRSNVGTFQKLFDLNRADNDLQNVEVAINDLRGLVQNFPNSVYVPYAQQLENYLEGLVAKQNLQVAQFYLKYDNPVAAYRRASIVISNFADTKYATPALQVLKESAHELKLAHYQDEIQALTTKLQTIKQRPQLEQEPKMINILPPFLQTANTASK